MPGYKRYSKKENYEQLYLCDEFRYEDESLKYYNKCSDDFLYDRNEDAYMIKAVMSRYLKDIYEKCGSVTIRDVILSRFYVESLKGLDENVIDKNYSREIKKMLDKDSYLKYGWNHDISNELMISYYSEGPYRRSGYRVIPRYKPERLED